MLNNKFFPQKQLVNNNKNTVEMPEIELNRYQTVNILQLFQISFRTHTLQLAQRKILGWEHCRKIITFNILYTMETWVFVRDSKEAIMIIRSVCTSDLKGFMQKNFKHGSYFVFLIILNI